MEKQSSGEFASANAAAGAQAAAVQEPGFSPEILVKHAAVYNIFNIQRHLTSAQTHRELRAVAMDTRRTAAKNPEPPTLRARPMAM